MSDYILVTQRVCLPLEEVFDTKAAKMQFGLAALIHSIRNTACIYLPLALCLFLTASLQDFWSDSRNQTLFSSGEWGETSYTFSGGPQSPGIPPDNYLPLRLYRPSWEISMWRMLQKLLKMLASKREFTCTWPVKHHLRQALCQHGSEIIRPWPCKRNVWPIIES